MPVVLSALATARSLGSGALLAALLTLAAVLPVGADPFRLPDFGLSANRLLSAAEERQLGRVFLKRVRQSLPILEDPLVEDYLQDLGYRLAAASEAATDRFTFFLIDQPTVNAFAGPDGLIGIYAGLVITSQSEAELAAVMAHEIAHVTQRHLLRAVEDQRRMIGPATALLIAAVILGAQVDAQAGAAAIAGVQAATLQRQIHFTRQNEEEADRLGITALAEAGFDPYAMPGFFERLSKTRRTYENQAPDFLLTHPVTTDRIADSLARAGQYRYRQRPDDLRFHLVRARLRELRQTDPARAAEEFKAHLDAHRYRNRTAETYGYALALARQGQNAAARDLARALLEEFPNQAELVILDARLEARLGAREAAIAQLQAATGLRPDHRPLRLAYAEILLEAGEYRRARATLEELARGQAGSVSVYRLLAEAALKSGDRPATHRYRGETLYLEGELEPAIRQLQLALKIPGLGFHQASEIQARLSDLEEEWEREKKDQKKTQSRQ